MVIPLLANQDLTPMLALGPVGCSLDLDGLSSVSSLVKAVFLV